MLTDPAEFREVDAFVQRLDNGTYHTSPSVPPNEQLVVEMVRTRMVLRDVIEFLEKNGLAEDLIQKGRIILGVGTPAPRHTPEPEDDLNEPLPPRTCAALDDEECTSCT